jgi:LysR family transcriptional regulator, low CO2-responsive transcriptional regulator
MRLTQLRSFYAVALHGGFTAGARALHISQPTVTTQVRALEVNYGIDLFVRRGRNVMLTDVGQTLFAMAQRVFAQEEEALNFLRETRELRTGLLRIGAVGPFHVMEMVSAFRRRYPKIEVSIKIGNSAETMRGLLAFETDVAVLAQYAREPLLHSVSYRSHPVVIFVRSDHRLAGRERIRIEELAEEDLIMREPGSTTRKALEDALRAAGVKPRLAMEIGSREAVREAVIQGLGISAVSEFEFVADPRLHAIKISDAKVTTHAHVACLQERREVRIVSAFFDVIDEILKRQSEQGLPHGAPVGTIPQRVATRNRTISGKPSVSGR